LKAVGQGGYAFVYKAKHGRFGTVVYKELNTQILNDRYVVMKCACYTLFVNSSM